MVVREEAGLVYLLLITIMVVMLSGCTSTAPSGFQPYSASTDGPGERHLVLRGLTEMVRNLPKSRTGNPLEYTVFGKKYEVMDSASGHVEQGLASWYGRKFHGRLTSSGEPYDMHSMTAAHKHLPLPTFVKVTRTDTGASLVVKVNDRGPFVDDRIIDLSYAAAVQLDMLDSGTAPVRIEALSSHDQNLVLASGADSNPEPVEPDAQLSDVPAVTPAAAAPAEVSPATASPSVNRTTLPVLQFGAFSQAYNAEALQAQLDGVLEIPIIIVEDVERRLYRVQSGPLSDQESLDEVLASLANAGIRHEAVLRRSP